MLTEFYSRVLRNLGLIVEADGFVYIGDDNSRMLMSIDNGKNLVIPTKEHIGSMYTLDDDNQPVITKCLYNPLNEDVIKGDSLSIKKTKRLIERRLGYTMAIIGEMLIKLIQDPSLQKQTKVITNQFLSAVNNVEWNTKTIVDDKTLDNWHKLYDKATSGTDYLIKIQLKKKESYDGQKWNRLAILGNSLYVALQEFTSKEPEVMGVKLRPKDAKLYKLIFEYILPDMDKTSYTIKIGSNDPESPTFIALMSLFSTIVDRTNKILNGIKHVSEEDYKQVYVEDLVTVKELGELNMYKQELLEIPSEIDVSRQAASGIPRPNLNDNIVSVQQPVYQQPPVQQPVQQVVPQQPYPQHAVTRQQARQVNTNDPLERALSNQSIPIGHNVNMASQMMYQQPMQQPYQAQPLSPLRVPTNGLPNPNEAMAMRNHMVQQQQMAYQQQPVYQQPIQQGYVQQPIQQPVYQQPMQQGYVQQPYPQQMMYQQPIQQPVYQQPMVGRPVAVNSNGMQQPTGPVVSNPSTYWRG